MAEAITTTKHQNSNLKTFIAAFAGMLLAVPVVAVLTTSVVKAQLGAITTNVNDQLAHIAAIQPASTVQTSSISGPSCQAPDLQTAAPASSTNTSGVLTGSATLWNTWGYNWGRSAITNSFNQTNTSTTTTNVNIHDNGNTKVDNRWSGNSLSLTDNRWSGNTYTDNRDSGNTSTKTTTNNNIHDNGNTNTDNRNSGNTNISDNGNTYTDNRNSGNTDKSTTTNTNNQTNVNTTVTAISTVSNDNDGLDIN